MLRRLAIALLLPCLPCASACRPAAAPPAKPCFTVRGDSQLRDNDANRTLDELADHIRLAPDDEALRHPKSIDEVRSILRRDLVYFFGNAAAFARTLDTPEGRFQEATLELLLGESQLVASQVLNAQTAWVASDLKIARAFAATERGQAHSSDRGRMLAQLVRVVEEGNKIADALGAVAPTHLARGAEVVERLRAEAKDEPRTQLLIAEIHRLRGEWPEFDATMKIVEAAPPPAFAGPAVCYLRGMEQAERFRRAERAADRMRECLVTFPRFVRAQAALVLMATNARAALRELAKLKEMNQDHYLVMLLEPTLAADQELSRPRPEAAGAR